MIDIALVFALVFAVNLLPAFGPPTWAVLVGLHFALDVSPVALVAAGALGAACGRWALAHGAWLLRARLSDDRRASLEALRSAIEDRPAGALAGLALFALSPLPSAQLFVAAGLTGSRIVPLVLAFFAGRVVSYSLYVGAAEAARERLGDSLLDSLRSPAGIAVQVAMLAMLVVLLKVDWRRVLARGRTPAAGPSRTTPA
ncbi:MAG: hypothetical protein QOJ89_133 [bacterium]|jgi:uncharacterized membrane protein YdjX (TVP38/TMEM64 family)